MNRKVVLAAFAALIVLLTALLLWRALRATPTSTTAEPAEQAPTKTEAPPPDTPPTELTLYFPNGDGLLEAEARTAVVASGQVARTEAACRALFEGPRNADLFAPFPPEVTFDRALLTDRGLLYINLSGPATPPAAGSLMETLRIWSVVSTALAATPEARGVVLTWNGAQLESLGGHIDTGRPLLARPELIANTP